MSRDTPISPPGTWPRAAAPDRRASRLVGPRAREHAGRVPRRLEDGAEMVELDVHLSRDGFLPVIHDERTERTTGEPGVVRELTMAELRAATPGAPRASSGRVKGYPSWATCSRLAREPAAGQRRGEGRPRASSRCWRERVAEHGMADSVVVSSFDPAVVRAASRARRLSLTGLLLERPAADPVGAAAAVGADAAARRAYVPHAGLVDADTPGRAARRGLDGQRARRDAAPGRAGRRCDPERRPAPAAGHRRIGAGAR